MTLGPMSITIATVDGMYSLRTALDLASLDEDMTGKFKDCNNCSLRDQCNGQTCQFASPLDREEYD